MARKITRRNNRFKLKAKKSYKKGGVPMDSLLDLKNLCDYNKYSFKYSNGIITIKTTDGTTLTCIGHGTLKNEKKRNAVADCFQKYRNYFNIEEYEQYKQQKELTKTEPFSKNRYVIHAKKELQNRNIPIYINDLESLNEYKLDNNRVAIDTEGWEDKQPLMIQISNGQSVLIFDYRRFKKEITKYLNDPQKILIFCDSASDLRALQLTNTNIIDIQHLWNKYMPRTLPKTPTLKYMASFINNIDPPMLKPNNSFYNNIYWENDYDEDHLYYAAYDVFVTYEICIIMHIEAQTQKYNTNIKNIESQIESLNIAESN